MPVSSTTRRPTAVRPQSTRSTSSTSRTLSNSRTAVGHSSRSTFANGRSTSADRADIASYRARGRTTASTQAQERRGLGSSTGTLRRGQNNETVRRLQERLSASGFDVGPADGKFGPRTERAVRDFQRSQGLRADGVVGRRTFGALNSSGVGSRTGDGFDAGRTNANAPTPSGNGTNGVAQMNRVNRGPGMSTGTITVNGNTYQFNSGAGNKYSTPTGEFRVTAHRNSRSDPGFVRNGVGFSFRMEDPRRPGSDRFYDPRAGRDRTALRIHPDGGGTGTAGCIGIVGDAATLRRFRDDMNAELRRNGGSYTLRVQ
jgi:peptidoglycan hydrolase-like protein with peptidoglycan-binding domain